ncbi:PUCC protein [Pacificibacter maritimus]|uniref:PUCC protein n=1 Tax=Pacificibacter maritimus TaxID=762213 RepID=A0A3N4UBG4_9RHOB|nr:phage holin family protein [Pacificibacter maritimus]RPE67138.1 PUCC protein [Pacificibacter maritimus]
MSTLKEKTVQGAKRAAWISLGTAMLCVGVAFLTAAAWMVLSAVKDAQFAALIIGLSYAGIGCIAVVIGTSSSHHSGRHVGPEHHPEPLTPHARSDDTFERMAAAFMTGMQSAKTFRK